ncbi:MAG: DUF1244 domain-containing protein [Pseudomonadota bacterium]
MSNQGNKHDDTNVTLSDQQRLHAQAHAFQVLVGHLQERTDVQNIDLMNLADFCRNCLSKWYRAGVESQGLTMGYEEARKEIYGMDYNDWKVKYQTPLTDQKPS